MVAVFRLASSHPQPETLPRGYPNDCPPFQGREERSGRWVVAAVARTSTASGCEGNETLASVESEPLMRRASESLNVRHEYDQQRRTRCEAWCEERAGAAAGAGAARQARGVIISTGQLRKTREVM